MRIISGIYRGKKLISPQSEKIRPTADRAREAVFNILYSKLKDSLAEYDLLDVFSGSGAFALEALSRGAKTVTLLDKDLTDLKKNVALFPKEQSKINLLRLDAANLPKSPKQYSLVFMDAPYKQGLSEKALLELSQKNWLKPQTICVVEVEKTEEITIPSSFELIDERVYGLAKVLFLSYQA